MNDIRRANALFTSKHEFLKALTLLYADRVPKWNKMDRTVYPPKSGREVESVYRQKSEKHEYYYLSTVSTRYQQRQYIVVSQSRVYELMLEDDAQARREKHDGWNIGKGSKSVLAGFLALAFHILSMQ